MSATRIWIELSLMSIKKKIKRVKKRYKVVKKKMIELRLCDLSCEECVIS